MKLTAYPSHPESPAIRPAPARREWMTRTRVSFAYRCLPLNIANAHGWELLCPAAFEAVWNGKKGVRGVVVTSEAPADQLPLSHFGYGILTFNVRMLFRTEPGINLWVAGPVNRPKDGIYALTGVVESDWRDRASTSARPSCR